MRTINCKKHGDQLLVLTPDYQAEKSMLECVKCVEYNQLEKLAKQQYENEQRTRQTSTQ